MSNCFSDIAIEKSAIAIVLEIGIRRLHFHLSRCFLEICRVWPSTNGRPRAPVQLTGPYCNWEDMIPLMMLTFAWLLFEPIRNSSKFICHTVIRIVRLFLNLSKNRPFSDRVTQKFDESPQKNNKVHLCHSSFVHHFVAICEFKLELQCGNAQTGTKFVLSSVTLIYYLDLLHEHHFCQWK